MDTITRIHRTLIMKEIPIPEAKLSELLHQSEIDQLPILLTENNEAKGVLLNIKVFEALIHTWKYTNRSLMPLSELQTKLQKSFREAGYDSRDKLIELVQTVKLEMVAERKQGMEF